jgi:hypothetical protein
MAARLDGGTSAKLIVRPTTSRDGFTIASVEITASFGTLMSINLDESR